MKAKARMLVEFDYPCDDSYEQPCEVEQVNGRLIITYREEGYGMTWEGDHTGDGHYTLTKVGEPSGVADLKRDRSGALSGLWQESGRHGTWTIRIKFNSKT